MTWLDRAKTALTAVESLGLATVVAGAGLLGFLLIGQCNGRRAAEAREAALAERVKLDEAQFTAAEEENQKVLDAQAAEITALRPELARLRATAGRVKVVTVERLVSAPTAASGTPRDPSKCLLALGDKGQISVDSVHVETEKGNQVVVWSARASRLTPEPPTDILTAEGRSPLSKMAEVEPPPQNPWGWGGSVGFALPGGLSLSAHAVTPRTHLPVLGSVNGLFSATGSRSAVVVSGGVLFW